MTGRQQDIDPKVEAFHQARITMLASQLRLAREELDLAVASAADDDLSMRRIAPWLEVSYQGAQNAKERGYAVRRRRSRHPLDPRGQ